MARAVLVAICTAHLCYLLYNYLENSTTARLIFHFEKLQIKKRTLCVR